MEGIVSQTLSGPNVSEDINATLLPKRELFLNMFLYMYTNLPVNAIVRLPHPRSGDSRGQETFLAPSTDKQTQNHDTECSNHHPSLSTLRSKGLSRSKMKIYICKKFSRRSCRTILLFDAGLLKFMFC